MREKNLDFEKTKMSRNVFKEVIDFDASCKKRGGAEVVDGSTMYLA